MSYSYRYLDLGAREITFPFWRGKLKGIKCIAFEPDPEAHRVVQEDLYKLGFNSESEVHATGISDEVGVVDLYVTEQPGCSSVCPPKPEFGEEFKRPQNFTVKTILPIKVCRLADILVADDHTPILVKCDIEGAELAALRSMGDSIEKVWLIQCEVNFIPYRENQCTPGEISDFLLGSDFIFAEEKDTGEYRYNGQNKFDPFNCAISDGLLMKTPFSKGPRCSADWVFLRNPRSIPETQILQYAKMCHDLLFFDITHMICVERQGIREFDDLLIRNRRSSRRWFFYLVITRLPARIAILMKRMVSN